MMRGIFVTGTDTGVGKTVVSAALLHHYRRMAPVRYWKPVQTGVEVDDDTTMVETLTGADRSAIVRDGVRLTRPLSPHLSARLSGVTIAIDALAGMAETQLSAAHVIVEGAGGVLVPLNGRELMVDLIERLSLPVVIAARSGLGTINHTLLTAEALRVRRLAVAGVVLVGPPNPENRAAIEHHGGVEVIGELPWLDPLTPGSLQAVSSGVDARGCLRDALTRGVGDR
jgi:dethiobiotin synthase